MNIDGTKICWAFGPLPVAPHTPGDPPPLTDAVPFDLAAADMRRAEGDVWAWCLVGVRCWIPGFPAMYGEATVGPCSFKSEAAFLSASSQFFNLRREALSKLAALVEGFTVAAVRYAVEPIDAKPGEEVFATCLPSGDAFRLTVVDPEAVCQRAEEKPAEGLVLLEAKPGAVGPLRFLALKPSELVRP